MSEGPAVDVHVEPPAELPPEPELPILPVDPHHERLVGIEGQLGEMRETLGHIKGTLESFPERFAEKGHEHPDLQGQIQAVRDELVGTEEEANDDVVELAPPEPPAEEPEEESVSDGEMHDGRGKLRWRW